MNSIAIWYEAKPGVQDPITAVDLHFNLWKIPVSHRRYKRFLDIGIKVARTNCIACFKLYFPTIVTAENLTDVAHRFVNNNNLVCAIFNENYKSTAIPGSKRSVIANADGESEFEVYELEASDFKFEAAYGGTIVRVQLPVSTSSIYIRIRVDNSFCERIISTSKPSNAILQSAFSKIELTDFRVNEARDLNRSLLERIDQEQRLSIRKAHFFYMISSEEEVVNHHAPFLSCRSLEQDLWKEYIGDSFLKAGNKMLAYHWKDTGTEHYNVLVKSRFESNNLGTILRYSVILGAITVLLNLVSSFIYKALGR